MKKSNELKTEKKQGLHPRNRHGTRYDFNALIETSPDLKKFVSKNKYNDDSIDFSNPDAVISLNKAILKKFYNINFWEIPANYLCPPIPGRVDYIHRVADLLASCNDGIIPKGNTIKLLDIGVGANCVYPLVANYEYQWNIVGSDCDQNALENANNIVNSNNLENSISFRLQSNSSKIFEGIIKDNDFFDLTISNPPFHSSLEEANAGAERKSRNLNTKNQKKNMPSKLVLNFGGQNTELIYEGGEVLFISRMIRESINYKKNCFWFSTLVSKSSSLPIIYEELKAANVSDFKTIDMEQGQKKSRFVAWTFSTKPQQLNWKLSKKH